jgi:hypothetical protein
MEFVSHLLTSVIVLAGDICGNRLGGDIGPGGLFDIGDGNRQVMALWHYHEGKGITGYQGGIGESFGELDLIQHWTIGDDEYERFVRCPSVIRRFLTHWPQLVLSMM